MKMFCLSDNVDTRTGLLLVGIDGAVVHTADEISAQMEKVRADKEIGVLLVMEKLAKQFPDIFMKMKMSLSLPLVVEIPDRHGTGRSKDFLMAYVREGIGVKI